MQRIRTIKPGFFRHYDLFKAEKETGFPLRVAFAALWTVSDRQGRFKWRPEEMKPDCLPHDELDFSRVLDALESRGFIVKYTSCGEIYGYIPSFTKHQVINNKERDSELPNPLECEVISTRDQRVTNASPKLENPTQVEQEGKGRGIGREDIPPLSPKGDDYSATFEYFWADIYPRNGASKKAAYQSWKKALKEAEHETIINGAQAYARYVERTGALVAHATTWLNQQRWTVDYDNQGHDTRTSRGHQPGKPGTADIIDAIVAKHDRQRNGDGNEVL